MKPHETLKKSLEEFDEEFVEMHPIRGHDMHNRPILYEMKFDDIDQLKSHLTTTSLSLIDSVMEMVKGKKKDIFPLDTKPEMSLESVEKLVEHNKGSFAYNSALTDLLSLLQQEKEEINKL